MKNLNLIILMFAGVTMLSSCKKEGCTDPIADNYSSSANDNDGSCQYTGEVVFWMSSGANNVNVTVNGVTDVISVNSLTAPNCGANGCATFTLPSGTYSFSAQEDAFFPTTWSGIVTVPKGDCFKQKLSY